MIKDIELKQIFKNKFKVTPLVVRAPGRINIIGEHTDYNDGFVLPAAIDKSVIVVIGRSGSAECNLVAVDLDEEFHFSIDEPLLPVEKGWVNYFIGVLAGIQENHPIKEGFNMMFSSSIPIGSGLSSSAAIECGFGYAISELFNLSINRGTLAKIGQMAEHNYARVKCGIMDQFAVVMGKKDQVIQLDCRSLDFEYTNIDLTDYAIVLCDTKVKHELASSEYNTRRKECEIGVKIMQKHDEHISALRDVKIQLLQKHKAEFDPVIYKRCEYVIKENLRVEIAFRALQNNDLKAFGELMYQSHEGLRDDYEVSCNELDILFELARKSDNVIGARMMGGGFGGCTINLVKKEKTQTFSDSIRTDYMQNTGIESEIHIVKITDGTRIINEY